MNDTRTPDPEARGPEQEETGPGGAPPQGPGLPEIDEDTIERVERGVFDAIGAERGLDDARGGDDSGSPARGRRRRRLVWGLGAAAAVVALAAIVSTSIVGGLGTQSTADRWTPAVGSAQAPDAESGESSSIAEEIGAVETQDAADGGSDSSGSTAADADREIITTGTTSLRVVDVPAAADEVTRLASEHGGRVQDLSLGGRHYHPMEEASGPDTIRSGWVTVRVPAESFDALRDDLRAVGEVIANEVTTSDVTEAAVDLRARIEAAQASVTRLTELMGEAGSVSDLISAEQALSERQADLESLQGQLESLEGQVAMSTLSIELTGESERVQPDPQGFGDGLSTGWNSFVATLNGIVIGLGFLVPWLAAIGIVLLAVWVVVRLRRRARRAPRGEAGAAG